MATTINAANLSIGMDISRLKEGMGASRSEISQLRSILKDSIDPVDKLKSQMVLLERAFKSGAIDAQQYARSLDHLKKNITEANAAASGGGLQGLVKGKFGQLAGMAAGAFTLSSIVGNVNEMDAIKDKADAIGVSYEDLLTVGRTFEESGGLSFEQAGEALGKMQVNLANARDNGGDLAKALQGVGLSAKDLAGMNAVQAFQKINTSFAQIGSQADRMRFATQLFGKAGIDMVPALEISANKFGEMNEHLRRSGRLNENNVQLLAEAKDAVIRMQDGWKGMSLMIASQVVPLLAKVMEDIEFSIKGWRNLKDMIVGTNLDNIQIGANEAGLVFNTKEFANMTKEQREAYTDELAQRMADYYRRKKAEDERKKIENEISEQQKAVLDRMDGVIAARKKERADELAAIDKGKEGTLSALRAKFETNKKNIETEADVQRVLQAQMQLEQRKLAMELASIYATRDKDSAEAQELAAKANEESAKRVAELQDAGTMATQAIKDREALSKMEKDAANLEQERQRILGATGPNVAATIAPAIKAGTVEAYKAVNQQNEQRAARAEQVAELKKINASLEKLNSERNVVLTRVR